MIYVSSSCVKAQTIKEAVETLVAHGFQNIELSGGTRYYPEIEEDLLALKSKHNLNYLCHNYFPPPKQDFVLNLASLNTGTYRQSLDHLMGLIELCARLDARKLGFHAGFLLDIKVDELGKAITAEQIQNEAASVERFCEAVALLQNHAKRNGIELYIENNVYSLKNAQRYDYQTVFMLTSFQDYLSLRKQIEIKPLIDLAHLKVSANVLNKDFVNEAQAFLAETDYIHVSDNNAEADLNWDVEQNSDVYQLLEEIDMSGKTVTLEIYQPIEKIRASYSLLEGLCHAE